MIKYKLWFSSIVIIIFMMLSTLSYAFWSQNIITEQGILLVADTVTYFETVFYAENSDLLIPPTAEKDSLANNNLLAEIEATVVENPIQMTLLSEVNCDIVINFSIEYKNTLGVFEILPDEIINCELWCDFNVFDETEPYLVAYNTEQSGYYVENFTDKQTGSLIVKLSFAIVDELTDPIYKQTDFKVSLSFQAVKQAGV